MPRILKMKLRVMNVPLKEPEVLQKKHLSGAKNKLKIVVNDNWQACGGDYKEFGTQIGFFMKDGHSFPLTKTWKNMDLAAIERVWVEIHDNANLPPESKKVCIDGMARSWRDWKGRVKKNGYYAFDSNEKRLANCPDGVIAEQWRALIAMWNSEKVQKRAEVNKKNVAKQNFWQSTGKKPLPILKQQLSDEGKSTDRLTVYMASRAASKDEATKKMLENIKLAVGDMPEDLQQDPAAREKLFVDIFGPDKHGRMRCMGRSITPTMIYGRRNGASVGENVRAEFEEKMELQKQEMEARIQEELAAPKFSRLRMVLLMGKTWFISSPASHLQYLISSISSLYRMSLSIINKDWIDLVNRASDGYVSGIEKFIKFAFSNRPPGTKEILCPCKKCSNRYYRDRVTVKEHCVNVGFEKWYKNWTFHGEEYIHLQSTQNQYKEEGKYEDSDVMGDRNVATNMRQLVEEVLGTHDRPREIDEVVQSDEATTKFLELLKDAESQLWEGCEEFTTLSFIVELLHLKAISRWSNKSFTELLKLLKRAMPKSAKIPNSFNGANKMTETKSNRPGRNDDVDTDVGRGMGKATEIALNFVTRTQAHRYVLFNTDAVQPYLQKHLDFLKKTMPRNQGRRIQAEHNEKFDSWFKDYVCGTKENLSEDIKLLAL
ncbi:hypothetical protein POM88_018106 [Heracleum sosnowskyi]|uniref:Transposase-associated domain-containing protein n=1 Tax=Heracleum sosnowskyi TaxID=360622 RepID=A0AAD8N028_9APIA|nr:hypothetical protein POM88_018106 [Heracleum sosnowskyi]